MATQLPPSASKTFPSPPKPTPIFSRNATTVGAPPAAYSSSLEFGKSFLIIFLLALLVLSFLGINVLSVAGKWLDALFGKVGPMFQKVVSMFAYSTGNVIDESSHAVATAAKTGIDIADGAVEDVGVLLKKGSGINSSGDALPAGPTLTPTNPEPDQSSNPIQNSISSGKTAWCLVGEDNGKRGCVSIGEADKCMSGQIFPNQTLCLNPTYTVSQYFGNVKAS